MSGNPWDIIKINYRIPSITGFMIVAGIVITFYALEYDKDDLLLLGVSILLLGVKVWLDNNKKYRKPRTSKRPNQKGHSHKKASGKSTSAWASKKKVEVIEKAEEIK